MMEILREWLVRIVGAAFLMTAASILTPKGAVKRIELLCCAVILLLSVLQPFYGRKLPQLPELSRLEERIRQQADEFREDGREEWESLIAEELVSYIETKAAELQFDCAVSVRMDTDENGIPFLEEVEITAEEENGALQRHLQQELGIAEERIRWRIT